MEIVSFQDVTATVRGTRIDLGWSQAELAHRAGVSREWLNTFEAGKATVEFGLVMRLFEELGLLFDLSQRVKSKDDSSPPAFDLDEFLSEYLK